MKKENVRMMATFSVFGLIGMLVGCNGNLSHNHPNQTPVWEIEAKAEESRLEIEKAEEVSVTETTYPAYTTASTTTFTTECPVTVTETLEEATTTTVEEIIIETTEELTEAYTESTAVAQTVAETVAQTVAVQGYTADEILLMRIASCEAYSQGAIGQALVMRVILNRCAISNVSVESVIYAPRQFSAVNTALFASGYISADAYQALALIRQGWDCSNGALYFIASNSYREGSWFSTLQYLFTYGDHMFFK